MLPARFLLAALLSILSALPVMAQTAPNAEPAVSFEDAARTVTASIQKNFYKEESGLYAQSLDKRDSEFMWGNGVMFSALVAATRHDPATYRPVLDRFFAALDRYWDKDARIPGYEPAPTHGNAHDKYYDDNQWMVITFMEAYDLTRDARYLDRAVETLKFSLSGWDDELDGGIWWHEGHKDGTKNTCSNAPAAVACLRVARYRERDENIEWARKLVKWTSDHLQDHDALFFDRVRVADSHIIRGKLTYNAALMLRANLGLYRATAEPDFLTEARRIGAACGFFIDENTGAYRNAWRFSHLLVEADLELYRATGDAAVLARARRTGDAAWSRWQKAPPKELIEQAAIARMLWLLADQETEKGRGFWAKADKPAGESQ